MATAPANLPLFYTDLMPLNSRDHGKYHMRTVDRATWLIGQHAVPLTVEEFTLAQRSFPIIFSSGDQPVPLALMGLNEGINVFVDDEGKFLQDNMYLPAYVRRYPFLLAKLQPDSDDLSLCFDPSCPVVGEFEEGLPLFTEDGQPSEACQGVLDFCQNFEQAGQKTQALVDELKKHDLLMEGEVAIQHTEFEQPFVYRGFQMVNQEKLREMRGDILRGWEQSGLLPLLHAHIFSLDLVREIFGRQTEQGKGPGGEARAAAAAAALKA